MAKKGILGVLAALIWTTGVFAHHPFTAEFDMNQPIMVVGTVTRVDWQNPHAFVFVDMKDDQGKVVNWKVEMASPAVLMKNGWGQTSLKAGDEVRIKAWKSKTNPALANADTITVGGKTMTAVSSFYGAPSAQLARAHRQSRAIGTSGTQELPKTASPLMLYALLGGLALASAMGLRAARQ
jgi:hypothetical protein